MRRTPATLLLLSCLLPRLAAQGETLLEPLVHTPAEALERYRTVIKRVPFAHHTEGRLKLAQFASQEHFQLLAQDYATTKDYTEWARYTIASMLGRKFTAAEYVGPLDDLRTRCAKPVDTWLWVKALTVKARNGGQDEVLAIAREDKDMLHRAAAILALGDTQSKQLSAAVQANCIDFPKKDHERSALVAAMSAALEQNRGWFKEDAYRAALTSYIQLLTPEVKLQHTSKYLMARHLQRLLNGPTLYIDATPWLELLERGAPPKRSGHTVTTPSFFGIEGDGMRYCYVIDMSDSMCREIDPNLKPQGPLTGAKKPKKPKGALPDQDDIPWHKIKTRFDLAREQLKISLQRLDDEKHFCVVWFGTDAGLMESCKGLIRATKANVDRTIAELDAIECGKADKVVSPDGKLRGNTNLHSGLRIAFGLTEKGFVDENSYVAAGPLSEGCDTIFLLSDGAPSCDGLGCTDRDYGEGKVVVDREYGAGANRTPTLNYNGPFVHDFLILQDLERMNAFRRVQIHCVGLGEANMALMRRIAESTHAAFYQVQHK